MCANLNVYPAFYAHCEHLFYIEIVLHIIITSRTHSSCIRTTRTISYEYQLMSYIFVFQMYQYVQRHDLMQQNWISGHRL
jgi:hypothetical protein